MAASTQEELDTAWLGRVRDISVGGIALLLNHRFELGTALIVELSAKSKVASRPRPVRVVHVTPEKKGRWIIGCAFASILSADELQGFLQD
jgi:hypothetical protein